MKEQYHRILVKYIPEAAVPKIADWIIDYGIHLKVSNERTTKLGDFRPLPNAIKGHRISVNYNLNQYAFLITLVHEIAHLTTWNEHKQKVKPHGIEWKSNFREMLLPFLTENVFPIELLPSLFDYLDNPAASSCSDMGLMRMLMKYDDIQRILLEDLPIQSVFKLQTGRVFQKGEQRRKYYRCIELSTGRHYLINPLAEVELMTA
jgi:SprT protein